MATCRIAYTLNNYQPVRCTLIGDEPLFYMDHESAFEEDIALEEEFGRDALEKGIAAFKEKMSLIDQLSDAAPQSGTAALVLEQFMDDQAYATKAGIRKKSQPVSTLENTLRKSRVAAAYLDFAKQFGTELRYCDEVPTAHYDRHASLIFINPALEFNEQILVTARELRRLWQHRNGALLHPLTFHPDQAILVNRAQTADLNVAMIRAAWELQLAGVKAPWERLEESSMSDLTRAFARDANLDFRTLNNGTAASAAFEAWFLSERCRNEDKQLIQTMLADYRGYVFDSAQSSAAITAELISALGSMPFGKNYLTPYVQTITGDALFTEVRDRSNANFLWFIKFERSFRETEQELQSDVSVPAQGSPDAITDTTPRIYNEKTANIVTLPFAQARSSAAAEPRHAVRSSVVNFKRERPE